MSNAYQPPQGPASVGGSRRLHINRINPISAGKLMGAMYALIGLIFGGIFALLTLVGVGAGAGAGGGGEALLGGAVMGVASVVFIPVMYGVMGLIGGMIGALIYNLVASFVGGIELEIDLQ